jgi:hypothetical protein
VVAVGQEDGLKIVQDTHKVLTQVALEVLEIQVALVD